MRTVFTAENPAQAHLVAGLLDGEGVACVVQGEMLFGARGDLGLTPATLPTVCVADEDAARAAQILARHAPSREPEPQDPDAQVRPARSRRLLRTALLWMLVPAVAATTGGPVLGLVAAAVAAVAFYVQAVLIAGDD